MRINELRHSIVEANKAYREGDPVMPDADFDKLVDELMDLNPFDPLLSQIGYAVSDERKQPLPIMMASMNKVKTYDMLIRWMQLHRISPATLLVLTPKFDGISLCVRENTKSVWTRGDGVHGQRSDEHFASVNYGKLHTDQIITVGELIMKRRTFASKYAKEFKNPRNLVAGQINAKEPAAHILSDCDYVRYGTDLSHVPKVQQLDICNKLNKVKVPYIVEQVAKISDARLQELFVTWRDDLDYELDGIIVEVVDPTLRKQLGTETGTGNPTYARAYKGNFEEVKETTVTGITWAVSKHGLVKPVIQVAPTALDGVTVTNVTGNNAKHIKELHVGTGAKVVIKRSGQVIPFLVNVKEKTQCNLPTKCPSCNVSLGWNETGVELVCSNPDCEAQALQRMVAFFSLMDVEEMGEGVCTQFYDAGFTTVRAVLNMSKQDMRAVPRFGDKKAATVYANIHNKMHNVPLSKVQHASSCFRGLGGKKLQLLEHLYQPASLQDVLEIGGFAETSAMEYIEGVRKFEKFITGLPITITKAAPVVRISSKCVGMVVVFTGFRDKELEKTIESAGGVIGPGVSKTTTHLIMATKGSGAQKEQKAIDLGIVIWDKPDLVKFLNTGG